MTSYAATKPAARRLTDAVTALVDNNVTWHEGRCVLQDSIYDRLKDSMTGRTAGTARSAAASRAPLRIDVLTLIAEIDRTTATWNHNHDFTPAALRELAAHNWTPQETQTAEDLADTIEKWTLTAEQILNEAPASVPLRLPCPACSKLWTYRRTETENVRTYALRASENGATCGACNAEWPVEQYEWLSRVLNSA